MGWRTSVYPFSNRLLETERKQLKTMGKFSRHTTAFKKTPNKSTKKTPPKPTPPQPPKQPNKIKTYLYSMEKKSA